ncbi:MAG: hypothetical protein ABR559_04650 [Gemmatimonadota bacterium]
MIRPSPLLDDLQRRWARDHLGTLDYPATLAIFAALWQEARTLNPDFPGDWREDLAPDFAVARAVNGLPPTP